MSITLRNCMTATILFPNANDVSVNKTICTKMGVAEEYNYNLQNIYDNVFRNQKVFRKSFRRITKGKKYSIAKKQYEYEINKTYFLGEDDAAHFHFERMAEIRKSYTKEFCMLANLY
ncbi:Oidioi.mRNA.OKI2018_I69.chr1.g2759.t1.cds [Oikopleura dioica]|uniref:Oidioi.mRNA.OKI2018_I69.chr1.g2759.t1.cds n=1 Tax=Oikopleura dioica TaxID=34765 RepID=A0ABN7T189_OIKDI|nr:Oidioi.mRNA.OKI2018_I69.chr1.g2759.t1.cds [Oikopleura dioica]